MKSLKLALFLLGCVGSLAVRAENTLKIGDPAPKLKVEKWLKGEPIKEFEKGSIYVVEFWAINCGPCIRQMPHLTKLQKQYADKKVHIVGVDGMEKKPAKGDPKLSDSEQKIALIQTFLDGPGKTKIGYAIAYDSGEMVEAYMDAFGEGGIPTAFVIDKAGKLVASIHPKNLDVVLEALVKDKFDPKTFQIQIQKESEADYLRSEITRVYLLAMESGKYESALKKVDEGIEMNDGHLALWQARKVNLLQRTKSNEASMELAKKMKNEYWEKPLELAHLFAEFYQPDNRELRKVVDDDFLDTIANRLDRTLKREVAALIERDFESEETAGDYLLPLARHFATKKEFEKARDYYKTALPNLYPEVQELARQELMKLPK